MFKKSFLLFIVFLQLLVSANAGVLSRIQKALEDKDFEKVEKLCRRSLEKDSINPGANYYLSVYFLDESNAAFNIDSAAAYIKLGQRDLSMASKDILEELPDVGLNEEAFSQQLDKVTRSAFLIARQTPTVELMNLYMEQFPEANELPMARRIRDSLAFEFVIHDNSWEGYKQYMNDYPQSPWVDEAKSRYQKLVFKDYTSDDKLESYIRFLEKFPKTPFRTEAERIIFERSTIDNSWETYQEFIRKYPDSQYASKAADILYHQAKEFYPERITEAINIHPKKDSLSHIAEKEAQNLIPFYENHQFGFITLHGNFQIDPKYDLIPKNYLCGDIEDSWIEVTENGQKNIINRNAETLLTDIQDLSKISESIWLVKGQKSQLYHSSGFLISETSVEQAIPLNNGWISYKHDYDWGILTPTGHQILPPVYHSINSKGSFIILETDKKFAFTTVDELLSENPEISGFEFDDFEVVNDTLIQAFTSDQECLINKNLQVKTPLAEHEIYFNSTFWYVKDSSGYREINPGSQTIQEKYYEEIEVNDGWLAFKNSGKWSLKSRLSDSLFYQDLDTIKLLSMDYAVIAKEDTSQILFQNNKKIDLSSQDRTRLISSPKGNSLFVEVSNKRSSTVIDNNGKITLENPGQEVTLLTDSLFKIKSNRKVGLMAGGGEWLLRNEYEVLDEKDGMVFLLKSGKIGAMDLSDSTLIPATYESRIQKFGKNYLVKKDGKLGVVNKSNDWMIKPEYDQILIWNDTSSWVRQGEVWLLMSTNDQPVIETVVSVKPWLELDNELLYVILGDDGYGLMSNRRGELLEMQYNEIINVGSSSQPVFFAEQHLKKAGFYVVTYFNIAGAVIKSQAFRPEEYNLIYCDQ